ncbi:MAG TPA: hypothetical protein VK763_05970 [Terriglobales bacterium]|jgi:hypothetical protein|nr:hypothetical protein [Terriglobales bacterium]
MNDTPIDPDLKYQDLREPRNETTARKWLFEQRLDYAWKFFDFHAKQRMSMFNFFLIFVGFVLSAYATLLKDGNRAVCALLAFTAAILTFVFLCLERRNEELVYIAEDVLLSLEGDVLFAEYKRMIPWPHRRSWLFGPMNRTPKAEHQSGIFLRQQAEDKDENIGFSKFEHGKWLPRFQVAIFVIFSLLIFIPWLPSSITICQHHYQLRIEANK